MLEQAFRIFTILPSMINWTAGSVSTYPSGEFLSDRIAGFWSYVRIIKVGLAAVWCIDVDWIRGSHDKMVCYVAGECLVEQDMSSCSTSHMGLC
jgi:hypothetical protein